MTNWRTNLFPAAVAIVVMALAAVAFTIGDDNPSIDQPAINAEVAEQSTTFSNLPTVGIDELPIEALDVLVLIGDGGPYPYRQDDGTFQNREGLLPDHPEGHYREYTVDTPGSSDRGARRIVAGDAGERYYTDDHYDSFREIDVGSPLGEAGS